MKDAVPVICGRFHKAVELIGGRWTGAIIQALLRGPTRYAVIRSAIPDISDRMLSDRLRILEAEGLVERRVVPETPVRVEYLLTAKGRSLDSALAAIGTWAEKWIELDPNAAPAATAFHIPELDHRRTDAHDSRHVGGKPRIKPKTSV